MLYIETFVTPLLPVFYFKLVFCCCSGTVIISTSFWSGALVEICHASSGAGGFSLSEWRVSSCSR